MRQLTLMAQGKWPELRKKKTGGASLAMLARAVPGSQYSQEGANGC